MIAALYNHSNDRSTIISVMASLKKMIQPPVTKAEQNAANAVYAQERTDATLPSEEAPMQHENDQRE